jgi:hypothetical protein
MIKQCEARSAAEPWPAEENGGRVGKFNGSRALRIQFLRHGMVGRRHNPVPLLPTSSSHRSPHCRLILADARRKSLIPQAYAGRAS